MKIMIVEDDYVIANAVKTHLETWAYKVHIISNFQRIIEEFSDYAPDLILMDISLPFYNGFHWCTEIRKLSNLPIIFISSASDNMNIVMAVNMGADDFIAKPFDFRVLTAKIQAVLRRSYDFLSVLDVLCHGDIEINNADMTLTAFEHKISLTKNEHRLLQVLFEKIGSVASRNELIERLWESDSFIDDNTLTVNITRLRKKLEDIGLADFIKTKKGIGYFIEK